MCLGPVSKEIFVPAEKPITAYRAFHRTATGILASTTHRKAYRNVTINYRDVKVDKKNERGFYALRDKDDLDKRFSGFTHATVILWGKIIVHRKGQDEKPGYRAEFMRIIEIRAPKIKK